MSRFSQLLMRNAAFLGPAGSQGVQGNAGTAGTTIFDAQNAAAQLVNIAVDTNFAISKDVGSGYPTVGKILRVTAFGRWSAGAAQSQAFKFKLGTIVNATPNIVLGGVNNGWWKVVSEIYFTAIGVGGSAQINSHFTYIGTGSTSPSMYDLSLGPTAIDTTIAQAVKHSFVSTVGNNTFNEDVQIIEALN